jgi:hypothetical protein
MSIVRRASTSGPVLDVTGVVVAVVVLASEATEMA